MYSYMVCINMVLAEKWNHRSFDLQKLALEAE